MESLIIDAVRALGALGVALLMFVENVFPPIPSEVIMPLAGYLASQGELHLGLVILLGTIGAAAGAGVWFYIGTRIDPLRLRTWIERHGAWLAMTPEDLDRAQEWFGRYGAISVFIGRLIPIVRTLISVPAGVTRMSPLRFFSYTFLGTAIWTAGLALGGWILGQEFHMIEEYLGIFSWIVVPVIVVTYLVRVAQLRRRARRASGRA